MWNSDPDTKAINITGSTSKWGNHATVESTIQYTVTPKAPHRWSMPLHILKEPSAVRKMRSMTADVSESKGSPVNRLFSVMHDTSVFAQQYVKDSTTTHQRDNH